MNVEIDLEQRFPGGGTIRFEENKIFKLKSADTWHVRCWGLSDEVGDLIVEKIRESKLKSRRNRVIAWRNIKREVLFQYQEKVCKKCPLFQRGSCVGVEETVYYPPRVSPEVRIFRKGDNKETEVEFAARVATGSCQK
jgi:hypothetical protein